MRPFETTVPFFDALRLTLDAARPIARTETLPIGACDGRVVARDVVAAIDVPSFDRAAMDGYAVRAADTTGATAANTRALACRARVFAGDVSPVPVGPWECVEIATGAPLPPGADAVVMVEETGREAGVVYVRSAVAVGQNVGARAGDVTAGAVVGRAGQTLTPAGLGALAATGVTAVEVYVQPRVALITTGNEVAEPGTPLGPAQIYDVNQLTLAALVTRHGGEPAALRTTGDDLEALAAALEEACRHDIGVFSGGSSVGDRDLVLDALRGRGEVLYHGIAVKPGKPTAFAVVNGVPVFAMPGNPTSCLSNGYLLLVPFLRRVARLPAWEPNVAHLPLARAIRSPADRHQFYTVRVVDGRVEAAFKGSSAITSMAGADGYIEIPPGTGELGAGTVVTVTLF